MQRTDDPMLGACIDHWEFTHKYERYLLEPSTLVFLEATIRYLKELKERREHEQRPVG